MFSISICTLFRSSSNELFFWRTSESLVFMFSLFSLVIVSSSWSFLLSSFLRVNSSSFSLSFSWSPSISITVLPSFSIRVSFSFFFSSMFVDSNSILLFISDLRMSSSAKSSYRLLSFSLSDAHMTFLSEISLSKSLSDCSSFWILSSIVANLCSNSTFSVSRTAILELESSIRAVFSVALSFICRRFSLINSVRFSIFSWYPFRLYISFFVSASFISISINLLP